MYDIHSNMEGSCSQEQEEQTEELEQECDTGDCIVSHHVSLIANEDRGRLLCWGSGEFGQTGRGRTNDISCQHGLLERFTMTPPGGRVKFVACGSSHTVIVTAADQIYSWGNGTSGQLGNGRKDMAQEAMKVDLQCPRGAAIKGVTCGGRHTYIWLTNGKLYNFGNNFFAQLGYDFHLATYKDNQVVPRLMRPLKHRLVVQVACGEKHSVFLFYGGQVAAVGDNSHGQIGSDCAEALVAKSVDKLSHVTFIACGSHHCLAIHDSGAIYVWGYGPACGSRARDLVEPRQCQTRRQNIVEVAGGTYHSAALTANGNVYTWGRGTEGQLGQGEKIRFLSHPRRVPWKSLQCEVVHISCGELYSSAVTVMGRLYLWGKSSHVITNNPTDVLFEPTSVDTGNIPIQSLSCGAWHVAAITGQHTDWKKKDELSDGEEETETQSVSSPDSSRGDRVIVRERTSMSLAEFYAPTPEIPRSSPEPSPKIIEINEGYKGRMSRDHVRATSVKEFCDDVCHNKMEPCHVKQDDDTTKETHQNCIKSSSSSLIGVDDDVLASVTVYGQSSVDMQRESGREMTRVDNRSPSAKTQKDILLSPVEHDETLPCDIDGDRAMYDKTRQLLLTAPVKLLTSDRVHSVVSCDARPTNHTVQSSTSYASRFVLPREKSTVSNKQMDFVEIMSDFAQQTSEVLQLKRNHTVFGLHTGLSPDSYQGRSAVKVMWNRPRLRARPLGQVPSAGKKLKQHAERRSIGVDGPCPLLLGVTKARAHVWSTPTTLSPLPQSLQYRPIYSSGMSWRQPRAKPSTDMFKTTYIERPPQTIRTGGRVSQSIQKTHLANRPRTEDTRHLP